MKTILALIIFSFSLSSQAQNYPTPPKPTGAESTDTAAAPPATSETMNQTGGTPGTVAPVEKVGSPEKAKRDLAPIEKDLEQKEAARRSEDEKVEGQENQTRPLKSRIGAHASIGVPHPVNFGLDYLTASEVFGFSLLGGGTSATVSDTKVSTNNVELQVRYHPWASAFYVGLGAGNHSLKADRTEVVSGGPVHAEAEVKGPYLAPQVGWIWLWDSGLNLGFQVGAVVPTGSSTDFKTDAPPGVKTHPDYINLERDVLDQGDQFGKSTLPLVTLLRVGWLF